MNLKREKRLWKKGYKGIVGLDEAGRGCERSDAEILTSNGWKFYIDINLKKDKVLSYTNDGYIKWQKIGKVIEKNFKGNLIELKNRGINIVVTPNHYFTVIRRVFRRNKIDNNRLKLVGYKVRKERKKATDLAVNDYIPRGGKWKGVNKKFFKLPKIDKQEAKLIDIKLWVAFLGIYLSEGSADYDKKSGSYRIIISQSRNASPDKYKKIYCLLEKLLFKFTECEKGFKCFDKQLCIYLRQFGNCYSKFIPKDVKDLSPQLLNILIKWLNLGDGSCYTGENRKEVCVYYTASKGLKDDLEEILLKAGWTYHTTIRPPKDRYIEGRLIKKENQVPCFGTRLRRNNKAQIKSLHRKEIFYKGKVFCFQLPKYHNFFVRRNGTGYFSGNSLAGPVVACAFVIKNKRLTKSLKYLLNQIKDSKKLSGKRREELFKLIKNNSQIEWGIGKVSEKIIDKINILQASKLAMKKALNNLKFTPNYLLIDGNFKIDSKSPQKSVIKGDDKVFSIAGSSIMAKVTRDRIMKKYDKKYPEYGFSKHKGYPTKLHRKMIKKHGICKIHRKTFKIL